ncbi:hypothetical protein [Kribbella sp. CA-293567]|uniref:hypothetical protein n=1 Tax=Kribbella sp. CA-293567 TaxID=3002436 RepID=UPI0022DD4F45|nr:hypothetical protein [Kribbella sp. CA-293567]WBQ05050.1 hypothetical protein OX958_34515 [Kribbella sp. CA-293567]
MTNPNVSESIPTFDAAEVASLIGALAAMQPVVRAAMPRWPQEYQDAVSKALALTSVSTLDGADLAYLWVGPFRIVLAPTTSDGEGS